MLSFENPILHIGLGIIFTLAIAKTVSFLLDFLKFIIKYFMEHNFNDTSPSTLLKKSNKAMHLMSALSSTLLGFVLFSFLLPYDNINFMGLNHHDLAVNYIIIPLGSTLFYPLSIFDTDVEFKTWRFFFSSYEKTIMDSLSQCRHFHIPMQHNSTLVSAAKTMANVDNLSHLLAALKVKENVLSSFNNDLLCLSARYPTITFFLFIGLITLLLLKVLYSGYLYQYREWSDVCKMFDLFNKICEKTPTALGIVDIYIDENGDTGRFCFHYLNDASQKLFHLDNEKMRNFKWFKTAQNAFSLFSKSRSSLSTLPTPPPSTSTPPLPTASSSSSSSSTLPISSSSIFTPSLPLSSSTNGASAISSDNVTNSTSTLNTSIFTTSTSNTPSTSTTTPPITPPRSTGEDPFNDDCMSSTSQSSDATSSTPSDPCWFNSFIASERECHQQTFDLLRKMKYSTESYNVVVGTTRRLSKNVLRGYFGVSDSSSKEKNNDKSKQNDQNINLALTATSDIIWDWQLLSNSITFSSKWCELLEMSDSNMKLSASYWRDRIHPDDIAQYDKNMESHLKGKSDIFECEFRLKNHDGNWVWILSKGKVISFTPTGSPCRMIGTNTNLDRVKAAEQAAKESERKWRELYELYKTRNSELDAALTEKDSALQETKYAATVKSEFLSIISHEIRTPLNGIIGLSGILADTSLTHDQRDLLSSIQECSDGLLLIVNDVLDFSKIEAKKLELETCPFDILRCLQSTLFLLDLRASEKGVSLRYRVEDGVHRWVMGDVGRLRQILINLVGNAVKFTDEGEVLVRVSRIGNSDHLNFEVSDTGIGIQEENLGRLFKSFSQCDAATSRKYGGTGLGLAISKQLVQLMGGDITVESEYGKGSCFKFHIVAPPCCDQSKPSAPFIPSSMQSSARSGHIRGHSAIEDIMDPATQPHYTDDYEKSDSTLNFSPFINHQDGRRHHQQQEDEDGGEGEVRFHERKDYVNNASETSSLNGSISNSSLSKSPYYDNVPPISTSPITRTDPMLPLQILLVEDNFINQKLAKRLLSRIGYEIDTASNGKEAFEAIQKKFYHIVFMDVQMPIMNGYESTQIIREKISAYDQPMIIALTANALQGDREKCLACGMDGYITKPVTLHALQTAVTKYGTEALVRRGESLLSLPSSPTTTPTTATIADDFAEFAKKYDDDDDDRSNQEEMLKISEIPLNLSHNIYPHAITSFQHPLATPSPSKTEMTIDPITLAFPSCD